MINWWKRNGKFLWKIMFWINVASTCLTLLAGDLTYLPFDVLLVIFCGWYAFFEENAAS